MKISANGLNLIKEFEGCYLKAYKCPAGVWTIGYGHTGTVDGIKVGPGMTISKGRAEQLLLETLDARYEPAVRRFSWLNQNQYDALVSFAYNLGPGIFKGSLLDAIVAKNYDSVASQILKYNKATVNGEFIELAGLTRRRKAESALFLKEDDEVVETSKLDINGKVKTVNVIKKDGQNYIKLRDLESPGIVIGYSEATKTPSITTK